MAKRKLNGSIAENRSPVSFSAEERQRMIAEAAYYRAEQRGFNDGDPVADWLQAEQEINNALLNHSAAQTSSRSPASDTRLSQRTASNTGGAR